MSIHRNRLKGAENMNMGNRLRALREERNMSQGDVEKLTGLLRCYTSRVEHGHTVPSLETLEKYARAFKVPLFKLFYEGDEPPVLPHLLRRPTLEDLAQGKSPKESQFLKRLFRSLHRLDRANRNLFLSLAQKMAGR
jgi:transcriptional regulator with XRE-family HTH domain